MPYTKNAHKAGATDAVLTAHYVVPLANPRFEGNTGLEGYDNGFLSQTYPSALMAAAQALKLWKRVLTSEPTAELDYFSVTSRRWEREEFDDRNFGHVVDALPVEVSQQLGYLDETGAITWDEREML